MQIYGHMVRHRMGNLGIKTLVTLLRLRGGGYLAGSVFY